MSRAEDSDGLLGVEVAYATPSRQTLIRLRVAPGCSAREAVLQSGIAEAWPQLDLDSAKMGVFSQLLEIYRPLTVSPQEARKKRARAP